MKNEVLMKVTGKEVDIFCEIYPYLVDSIVMKRGQTILYVQLYKALYICVQSALLWYKLYLSTLKDMVFELNPYDLFLSNANIEGKQCTVCWYVDDNKISHEDPKVVGKAIKMIEGKFGKMTQTSGDEHNFLGANI